MLLFQSIIESNLFSWLLALMTTTMGTGIAFYIKFLIDQKKRRKDILREEVDVIIEKVEAVCELVIDYWSKPKRRYCTSDTHSSEPIELEVAEAKILGRLYPLIHYISSLNDDVLTESMGLLADSCSGGKFQANERPYDLGKISEVEYRKGDLITLLYKFRREL